MGITQTSFKELVHYDPVTGIFINRVGRGESEKGKILGYKNAGGYLKIRLGKKLYSLHRLAFLYVEGYFPEHCVDHINGITTDNRWENLRHVTQQCNMQNRKLNKNSVTGFPGVSLRSNKTTWLASTRYRGRNIHLGIYKTPLDAALAKFTWESQCPQWHCNARSVLYKTIKAVWPKFNPQD